jgi:hypothetical protein
MFTPFDIIARDKKGDIEALSPPKSCGTLPHTDLVCLMRLSPVVGAWCERVFMECLDFLPASISAKSRPPLDTVLLVEFRRYASSSKENDGLLVEVSQFRVTSTRPRDHANSALCNPEELLGHLSWAALSAGTLG